ncbi:MAG: transporter, partial [Microvirga sp.]
MSLQAAFVAAALVSGTVVGSAQTAPVFNPARANTGTLGVISGGADGTYIRIAADLANVLDGEDLRVLPMIGRGSLQNLRDIMFLRGVDIGIVQM